MKKFLSILLALVMCLGLFVSCNNEEQPSNQENEETVKYYKKIGGLIYIGDDMPAIGSNSATSGFPFGSYYKLILTYDEFIEFVSDSDGMEKDESFFDENFLYVMCDYTSTSRYEPDERNIGYRNFYIDNKTAYITLDKTFAFNVNGGGGNPATSIKYTYITIPKEALNGADVSSVESYKIIQNKVQYYYSVSYSTEELDGDYENGDAWILNNEESYENFKENVYPLIRNLDFEENIYIAVYREGTDLSKEIGYFDLINEGEETKLVTYRFPVKESDSKPISTKLHLVVVPRGRLKFGIDSLKSTENIKIEIKDIEYFD